MAKRSRQILRDSGEDSEPVFDFAEYTGKILLDIRGYSWNEMNKLKEEDVESYC